jgi:hypothetical protein
VSSTKIKLTLLSEAEAEAVAAAQPDEPPTCKCKHPNCKPYNVLLDIESGHVSNVVCANCELPCVISDDLEFLEGEGVPARLTATMEKHSNPIVGTEYDYFLVLDAQPYEADQ